ncbi:GIY-YIG nuclease family protein [Candidatus Woesebacteria bacterium]|nr:GIY-YIG nuclease family protein [Candidatus Woesebacteria bacterium]QQG47220.1 MAG: GIY-YIG nuclease family protein [Candidatus Woesebacteria bacterium]
MYYVYILRSLTTGKHYIGSTCNLEKRLLRHNKGGSKYTRNKGPYEIVYSENLILETRRLTEN